MATVGDPPNGIWNYPKPTGCEPGDSRYSKLIPLLTSTWVMTRAEVVEYYKLKQDGLKLKSHVVITFSNREVECAVNRFTKD